MGEAYEEPHGDDEILVMDLVAQYGWNAAASGYHHYLNHVTRHAARCHCGGLLYCLGNDRVTCCWYRCYYHQHWVPKEVVHYIEEDTLERPH